MTGKRSPEGFFYVKHGIEQAISRGLAYAPYSDLIWCETATPNLAEAKKFAVRFQSASSLSIGMTKSMLNSSYERDLKTSLEIESSAQAIANNSDYHKEAVKRFLNKEPSIFDWEKLSK